MPTTEPATGCAAPSCEPCALPNASALCRADACAIDACVNGFGDCDTKPADGCETDLRTSAAHCGACGNACAPDQVCAAGACVSKGAAEASAWLATQTSGFCGDAYNKLMNLCGDVEFCFDTRVMRAYPQGLSLDFGFVWDGQKADRALLDVGGDCDQKRIGVVPQGISAFGVFTTFATLSPGKHVLGYRITPTGGAVFVDGLKVATVAPPTKPLELLGACGPGIVVGARISYWWEANQQPNHQRVAAFLVHLREGVSDLDAWSVEKATTPQASTVFLFDATTVTAGQTTWPARVGGLVGVGKNAKDGTPQLDAGASGPVPSWQPLASCAL